MPLDLILIAIALMALSGIPGIFTKGNSSAAQIISTGMMAAGSLAGLAGAGMGIFRPKGAEYVFPWPAMGNTLVGVDPLSAFFLVPVFLIGGLGSIYGTGYWSHKHHPSNGRKLTFFWGLMTGGMGLLIISKHAMGFLLGWEIMALSAFFLVSTEDEDEECRRSGLVYLISTHISTLILFALFVLWRWATGSFDLVPVVEGSVSPAALNIIFFLALVGFGLKAGMMPFHFWLPGAHANAPSHVSAIFSGVLIKMGIYGLVRLTLLMPAPPFMWGSVILLFGAVSGILGVVFALAQHDLKRLLAYHSIENIGIILMGLGLALIGRAADRHEWFALGMAGCLLHVWNHGLFKSLLFFGAGSVIHATKKRNIDSLGELAKYMPLTSLFFLTGAVAISGIPPLNGFVSEFFLYIGFLKTMTTPGVDSFGIALSVPVLALIGALASACFVKVYGAVFLGSPRSMDAGEPHESSPAMTAPMAVLAALCILIGTAPIIVSPILESVTGSRILSDIVPFKILSVTAIALAAGVSLLTVIYNLSARKRRDTGTWDCGYAEPTSRMQYTASSFARSVNTMFAWVLKPHENKPAITDLAPKPSSSESHVDELVLDRFLIPAFQRIRQAFSWFYRFQKGQAQSYILYILIAVLIFLSTQIPFMDLLALLLER